MPELPTDHAGLETLPFEACLRLLASVPLGRVGFCADGEVVVLPVNHAIDGQDVVFRTARGSKLAAAEKQDLVAFEADDYDGQTRSGWSVLMTGRAAVVDEDAEIQHLGGLGLRPWAATIEHPFWVRIRPTSVTGRRIPGPPGSAR
jgi:nitroimidazol reductase NimA-like FMN-containing flavoprotein (pyridoxamine 5'-phosphate oxidase superfamily)